MEARVQAFTLLDGAQPASRTSEALAAFISAAERTLAIAIYDVRLPDPYDDPVRAALEAAHARGVDVRLLYNKDYPDEIPVPPPPNTEPALLESLPFPTVPSRASPT